MANIINIYEHLFNRKADSRAKNALRKHFVIDINALPIEDDTELNKRIKMIWLKMLQGDEQAPSYLTFAMIAVLGMAFGGVFFFNFLYQKYSYGKAFDLISAGTIPLSNIAIGLKVGASLFLVIFLLSTFRRGTQFNKESLKD